MKKKAPASILAASAASVIFGASAGAATMTFTPDTLAELDTVGTVILSSGNNTGGGTPPAVTTSTITDPSVEAPNELRITTVIDSAGFAVYRHEIVGATFDLSTLGAINSIAFSVDVREPSSASADTPLYLGFTQGGIDYLYTDNTGTNADIFNFRNENSSTFANISASGILEDEFGEYPGNIVNEVDQTSNPDLSATGDALQFAIYSFSGSNASSTRVSDFRNAVLTIDYVPEPSSAMLLLGSLCGLVLRRRR